MTAQQSRVESIPYGISQKVERQHHDGDGDTREDHQWLMGDRDVRDYTPSILPQVGVGGGMPTPKKPSDASRIVATPSCAVASTKYGAIHYGTICCTMMRTFAATMASNCGLE
jgi:hypothetical protein